MTKFEMLNQIFKQSGWTVTDSVDENGAAVVVATDKTEGGKTSLKKGDFER